jgi:beta-hydroxylase
MTTAEAPKSRRRHLMRKIGKKLFRGVFLEYLAKQSRIPNDPVLDETLFPWSQELRANWTVVRDELEVLLRHRDALPRFQDISPDQKRISPDDLWRTVVLYGFGSRAELSCELCPETARLLERVPRLESAFFSVLAPGKHVPRHRGVTKGMVRCHLGLKVPSDAEKCYMECGDARFHWREGELVFFDDTYPHAVWNDTPEERAVLLFDFERPMTRRGQWLSRLMIRVLRHTPYFKDAHRNQQAWEERYRREVAAQGGATT